MRSRWLGFCLVFFAGWVQAQELSRPGGIADAEETLIVTGYRALFTCSAHFFAGRSWDEIDRIEMVDNRDLGFPPPVIDDQRQLVVAADHTGVPMIAVYRNSMGCTLLPPHWDESRVPDLPYVAYPQMRNNPQQKFPSGDSLRLPGNGVTRSHPQLKGLVDKAFDGKSFGEGSVTVGLMIIKDGEVLVERYREGFGVHSGYRTWSTAKSISAAVIGIAVGEGLLAVDAPAPIPEWQSGDDPRKRITLKNLLQMSSGLMSGGNNTNAVYFGGQDAISAITSTALEVEPGTRWKYANNDTLLSLRALRAQLGNDLNYLRYPYDKLLHVIGMYHTRMETDHQGNFIGSSQVYTTARDLARFGLLLSQDGVWEGERVLPEGWVEFVTTPAATRPRKEGERGYGAQFWLLDTLAGVPEGTYTTAGNKGQFVTVVPDQNLVVVRTGVNPNGVRWAAHEFIAELVTIL